MNMYAAFDETLALARALGMDELVGKGKEELSYDHLVSMARKIEDAAQRGTPFPEDKLGRWLGWAQAAVVARTNATLVDMERINRKYAE